MLTVDGKSDLYVLNGGTDTGDDSTDTISDAIAQKKLYIEPTLSPTDAKISGSLRTALYAYLSREPFTHQYCEGLEDDYQDYDLSAASARANYNPYIRRDNYPFRVGEFVYIDLLLNGDDLVAQQASYDAVIKFLVDSGVPQSELPGNAPSSDDHRIFLVNGWVHSLSCARWPDSMKSTALTLPRVPALKGLTCSLELLNVPATIWGWNTLCPGATLLQICWLPKKPSNLKMHRRPDLADGRPVLA